MRGDKLFGIRFEWDSILHKDVKSDMQMMNFTGSCIIARTEGKNSWLNSDFLECYVNFDEAYELHFTEGTLDEVLDLGEAIVKAKCSASCPLFHPIRK